MIILQYRREKILLQLLSTKAVCVRHQLYNLSSPHNFSQVIVDAKRFPDTVIDISFYFSAKETF